MRKLDSYPKMQLEYVKAVLREREDGKRNFDDEVLVTHI